MSMNKMHGTNSLRLTTVMSDRKYKTVVIDPPWDVTAPIRAKHAKFRIIPPIPYKTMTDDQITNFPIHDFADKDCCLFLWTIQKKLRFALDLLDVWRFKYQRCITWDKGNGIVNNGFANHTEFLLYAYCGRNQIRYKKPMSTIQRYKRRKHSEKPHGIYAKIMVRTPEPRIDIFARRRHVGFDAYGDEVDDTPYDVFSYGGS